MSLVLVDSAKLSAIQADEQLILADLGTITTDANNAEAALASALAKISGANVADPTASALLDSIANDLASAHTSATAVKAGLEAAVAPAPASTPAA